MRSEFMWDVQRLDVSFQYTEIKFALRSSKVVVNNNITNIKDMPNAFQQNLTDFYRPRGVTRAHIVAAGDKNRYHSN